MKNGHEELVPVYVQMPPDSTDIYAMCMESDTAAHFAFWLCNQANITYPPSGEHQ